MDRKMRRRFWPESSAAVIAAGLAALMALWPDWIAGLTGQTPGDGNGSFETGHVTGRTNRCASTSAPSRTPTPGAAAPTWGPARRRGSRSRPGPPRRAGRGGPVVVGRDCSARSLVTAHPRTRHRLAARSQKYGLRDGTGSGNCQASNSAVSIFPAGLAGFRWMWEHGSGALARPSPPAKLGVTPALGGVPCRAAACMVAPVGAQRRTVRMPAGS